MSMPLSVSSTMVNGQCNRNAQHSWVFFLMPCEYESMSLSCTPSMPNRANMRPTSERSARTPYSRARVDTYSHPVRNAGTSSLPPTCMMPVLASAEVCFRPSMVMLPSRRSSTSHTRLIRVVFPEPLGPIIPTILACGTCRDTDRNTSPRRP